MEEEAGRLLEPEVVDDIKGMGFQTPQGNSTCGLVEIVTSCTGLLKLQTDRIPP